MTEEILDKNWKMKSLTDREFLETTVPGSVYQTYLAHGKMEDPFYRDNEEKALELMKEDFEFITEFEVSDEPVSYTHLDVYKRQSNGKASAAWGCICAWTVSGRCTAWWPL